MGQGGKRLLALKAEISYRCAQVIERRSAQVRLGSPRRCVAQEGLMGVIRRAGSVAGILAGRDVDVALVVELFACVSRVQTTSQLAEWEGPD